MKKKAKKLKLVKNVKPSQEQVQEMETGTANYAGAIGRGLLAGLFGTAVMTVAQMIEMKITGRKPSDTPYKAVKEVSGLKAEKDTDTKQLSQLIHFAYGTGWGIPRALLAEAGAGTATGTAAHFGAIWGTALVMLPSLGVAKPATEWEPEEIGKDAAFHAVYAVATGVAADLLTKWAHQKK
ncbi:MAG: hypothetical protein LPJ89_02885 [Hymenobacteraceae bacterium]|nr:hypothetical protein [Hymenobacteraceae bacterium]MDX5396929.1 hypothetical protein [Hymenobacteraceae bacterium]MDX5442711.1 hypothetical protein [Hymenobacteraceae bacterium]MDX5513003.1 hypothetical protein [Hymenobacteraceae bacterium]